MNGMIVARKDNHRIIVSMDCNMCREQTPHIICGTPAHIASATQCLKCGHYFDIDSGLNIQSLIQPEGYNNDDCR